MRMKKILFIAAVALAAAACSKTYNVGPESQKAIDFTSWSETMSKAYTNTWSNGDAFTVYGAKFMTSADATGTKVFDGVNVSYDGTKWGYTETKYWDLTAFKYAFYAFMPSAQLNTGTTAGVFASKEVTFANPTANSEDILVANEYIRERESGKIPTDVVPITFNHMASMVDVKVKKDASLGTATVKITSATLKDIANKGTLNVASYNASHAPVATWTPSAGEKTNYVSTTATASSNLTVTAATTYDASGVAGTTTPEANSLFANYVVLPQTLDAGQALVLSYTISADGATAAEYNDVEVVLNTFVTTDNTANAGTTIGSWEKGTHYTYYVTIGANAITFSATVQDWAEVSGYKYILQ